MPPPISCKEVNSVFKHKLVLQPSTLRSQTSGPHAYSQTRCSVSLLLPPHFASFPCSSSVPQCVYTSCLLYLGKYYCLLYLFLEQRVGFKVQFHKIMLFKNLYHKYGIFKHLGRSRKLCGVFQPLCGHQLLSAFSLPLLLRNDHSYVKGIC